MNTETPALAERLTAWSARARVLREQIAQHPEPPALTHHLAAALLAELPIAVLLDAAKAHGDGLVIIIDVLATRPPAANGGILAWGDLPVLDEETAAALAPILEAPSL